MKLQEIKKELDRIVNVINENIDSFNEHVDYLYKIKLVNSLRPAIDKPDWIEIIYEGLPYIEGYYKGSIHRPTEFLDAFLSKLEQGK